MYRLRTMIATLITVAIVIGIALWPDAAGAGAGAFYDVREGQWYHDTIEEAVQLNLVYGYPDGRFYPDRTVSYAEFVSIASKGKPLSPVSGQTAHWAADTMAAALHAGWYDWDEIPPTGERYDAPIPRKIAAKILANAFIPEIKGSYSKWSDVIRDFSSIEGRYYEPVFSLYEAGLASGDEKGNFNPDKGLTRAEACSLIVKAIGKSGVVSGAAPTGVSDIASDNESGNASDNESDAAYSGASGVLPSGMYGVKNLKVVGTQLCTEDETPVVLRGMSSHGIHWYSRYASKDSIKGTRDYGANVFRIAMYTAEGGYLSDSKIKNEVFEAVDASISLDMYAVIDWHILSDGNPRTHEKQAKAFFDEAAKRYAGNPAVIYEIANEPNGHVTWEKDIRPYAMEIIPVIRKHSPDAIILVGSGTWSQDIHDIAKNPLPFENVMYTLHFYAGTHKESLRARMVTALKDGTPIFVSEWGTSDASGNGGVHIEESKKWLELLKQYNVSWINWSLCDKNESSAALKPGTGAYGKWTENDLSESGKFVFKQF